MATLLALKRRIKAAQNVSKTTKAMQMIAVSKLRRAQEAALASRPYVEKLSYLSKTVGQKASSLFTHPYLETNSKTGKKLMVVFSPDKGLCGALVTNLVREVLKYNAKEYVFLVVGKKVEHYVVQVNQEIVASFPFGTTLPAFEVVFPIIQIIEDYYSNKKVDSVTILSTKFVNVFSQKVQTQELLPIAMKTTDGDNNKENKSADFQIFEPDAKEILPSLLKRYLEMEIYQQLLESYLSEQAARMLSMQNATNNANDIIGDLKLEYNKNRQAKITSEILDIAGGKTHAN